MKRCQYCAGECASADLGPLIVPELGWLWSAVGAAADRRGDNVMSEGRLTVIAPAHAGERAAAVGLLGGSTLRAGQRRVVDLSDLTSKLRRRGASLTPGAVAAHAVRRPLAIKAEEKRVREQLLDEIRNDLEARLHQLPDHVRQRVDVVEVWSHLRTAGWHARLAAHPHPDVLIAQSAKVLASLPPADERTDRRTLVPTDPHALDDGTPLAGLVLAIVRLSGMKARAAWHILGVDYDDLTGGLLALGIQPAGWSLPADAVVTIPPRELDRSKWSVPPNGETWVFVTENPSVVAAAAQIAGDHRDVPVRLLCTVGTPSALEVAAVRALADAGWRVAVRADFDLAGLGHVRAVLDACPDAIPWRMHAEDYLASNPTLVKDHSIPVTKLDTPWDPQLATAMTETRAPGFEEALLPQLLVDLERGCPPQR